jgi:hypothetical protein
MSWSGLWRLMIPTAYACDLLRSRQTLMCSAVNPSPTAADRLTTVHGCANGVQPCHNCDHPRALIVIRTPSWSRQERAGSAAAVPRDGHSSLLSLSRGTTAHA